MSGLSICKTPQGADYTACGFSEKDLFLTSSQFYREERCQRMACMRIYADVDALNPTECLTSPDYYPVKLRADILAPLYTVCAALASTSPPPATTTPPPPVSLTPPPQLFPPPSTQPPAATPQVTTDSPSIASPTKEAPTVMTPPLFDGSVAPDTPNGTQPSRPSLGSESPASLVASPAPAVDSNRTASPPHPSDPVWTSQPPIITGSTTSGGSSSGVTVGIGLAIVAVLLGLGVVVGWGLRRSKRVGKHASSATETTSDVAAAYMLSDDSHSDHKQHSPELAQREALLRSDVGLESYRLDAHMLTTTRFLGRGSYALVYLVRLHDGTSLASKRLAPHHQSRNHLSQLLAEVHIVSVLQHSSIVGFIGVAWTSPLNFQVLFEHMEGGDLRNYLDRTKSTTLTTSMRSSWTLRKMRMAIAIVEGLVYAHSFNPPLVHRDLKSRNILLTKDLQAKISDFGVSRYLSESDTMTTGIGTNRWLAPEVIKGGGRYTERCDIYSFGVVLTELDTHEIPLLQEQEAARSNGQQPSELWLLEAVATGKICPSLSASCPPEICEIATQCLSIEAEKRPDAVELSYRLRLVLDKTMSMWT